MNDIPRKREDFSFRYAPYADTQDGMLMAFLKTGDGVRSGKELLLESARAFWMVTACQSEDTLSQEELRQLGLNCCRALERQADYIRECLHLQIQPSINSELEHTNHNGWNGKAKPVERVTQTMWQ